MMPGKPTIAAYTASGMSILAGFTMSEIAAFVGMCCAIITTAINIIVQIRRDRRETKAEKEKEIKK